MKKFIFNLTTKNSATYWYVKMYYKSFISG